MELLLLPAWLGSRYLSQFIIEVLLERSRIRADHAAPVHEHRWRALHFDRDAVRAAGFDGGGRFGSGHARLEGIGVQARLPGEVGDLAPGVSR